MLLFSQSCCHGVLMCTLRCFYCLPFANGIELRFMSAFDAMDCIHQTHVKVSEHTSMLRLSLVGAVDLTWSDIPRPWWQEQNSVYNQTVLNICKCSSSKCIFVRCDSCREDQIFDFTSTPNVAWSYFVSFFFFLANFRTTFNSWNLKSDHSSRKQLVACCYIISAFCFLCVMHCNNSLEFLETTMW